MKLKKVLLLTGALTFASLVQADFQSDFDAATTDADKLAVLSAALTASPSSRVAYQRYALANSSIHPRLLLTTMAQVLASSDSKGRFGGPNGTPKPGSGS